MRRFVKIKFVDELDTDWEFEAVLNLDAVKLVTPHDDDRYSLIHIGQEHGTFCIKCKLDDVITYLEGEYMKQSSQIGKLL